MKKSLLAALVGGVLLSAQATAATYDVAIFHSDRDAFAEPYKWWAEEVAKRTDGRVQFKTHYSAALAPLTEVFNAVRNGVVPVGLSAPSVMTGQLPALGYIEAIGGMPGDLNKAKSALDSLYPALENLFRPQGVEFLWMQPAFGGAVVCGSKHLKEPADWKGTKIRSSGRWQSAQVQQMGASPTAIDPGELYLALQNKTVDCALIVNSLGFSLKLHEVAPKITQLDQPINANMYLMNKDVWAKLSGADKKAIKEVGKEANRRAADTIFKAQDEALAKMKAAGADIQSLNDAQKKAYRDAMRPIFTKIGEAAGAAGKPFADVLSSNW